MSTTAWMLRNDGNAFPVQIHLYTMQDEDFSSEAEVASFLLLCGRSDQDQCEYALDAWMAELVKDEVTEDSSVDDIDEVLKDRLSHLPYKFPYPMKPGEYMAIHYKLDNWSDYASLMDFCDHIEESPQPIWNSIARSVNQQFCRTRYGGQYNTEKGSHEMWFRVSSLGFNWSDVIYTWVADHYQSLNIDTVTVCRDAESDYGFDHRGKPEYFYKAKDGTKYYQMPVDDFLAAEHESNPIFAQMNVGAGPRHVMVTMLAAGYSINSAEQQSGIEFSSMSKYMLRDERLNCIGGSTFIDEAHPRTQFRMAQLVQRIEQTYPHMQVQDIDLKPYEYANGRTVDSLEISYTEGHAEVKHIQLIMNKGLSRTTNDELMRQLRGMMR